MDVLSHFPSGPLAALLPASTDPYFGVSLDSLWLPVLIGLLLVNAYFVALETWLSQPLPAPAKGELTASSSSALHKVQNRPGRVRLLARLGVSMATLGLGVLLGTWLPELLVSVFGMEAQTYTGVGVLLSYLLLVALHVGVGGYLPARLAIRYPQRVARWTSPGAVVLSTVFTPFLALAERLFELFCRLLGLGLHSGLSDPLQDPLEPNGDVRSPHNGEGAPESEMISSVLLLYELVATQIMIPRTEMVCLPHSATIADAVSLVAKEGHDRYPVYGENMDEIVGVLLIKDLLSHLAAHPDASDSPIVELYREALFVPGSLPCAQIVTQLRERRTRLAIVLDEYGGTAGMLTLGDVLERIVGDVEEEEEPEELDDLVVIDDRTFSLSGLVLSEDLENRFDIEIDDELNDTVGGVVFSLLGRAPQVGDEIEIQGWRFQVELLDGLRIDRLLVTAPLGARADLGSWSRSNSSGG